MLAQLININPEDHDLEEWCFAHFQDHLDIRQAIQSQHGFNLQVQDIDRINPNDFTGWLERHQLMHNDMNGVLKLGGNDLTQVDFRNLGQRVTWLWLNFSEHRNASSALKI